MSDCQVRACSALATVRCDAGFRYCDLHKKHGHVDRKRVARAYLRSIRPNGEYVPRRRRR